MVTMIAALLSCVFVLVLVQCKVYCVNTQCVVTLLELFGLALIHYLHTL